MRLIRKLLRANLSVVGFALANLVGVAIVLLAVQAYRDVRPALSQPDSFLSGDFLIINKRVAVLGSGSGFSREELRELASKPFIVDVGEFTTASYGITGRIAAVGAQLETYLFFESVPDRFLDVHSDLWGFAAGDRVVPIILPRNYLNLYNFGFAPSHGLPQVSPELFGLITIDLELDGPDRTERLKGRVVAFSNRINTILVPQSFIEWSNAELSASAYREPSRLIIEVTDSTDPELHKFLRANDLEVEGGNLDGGRTLYFLRLATAVVAGVGVVITALSFFVLMLSIFLLLQKNTRKLENLLLLGYSVRQVARPYQLLTLGLNAAMLVVAVCAVMCVRSAYMPYIEFIAPGYMPGGIGVTLLVGLGVVTCVTLLNCMAVKRKIDSLRRH